LAIGSGKDESFDFDINAFIQRYKMDLMTTFNSLKILELNETLVVLRKCTAINTNENCGQQHSGLQFSGEVCQPRPLYQYDLPHTSRNF
jgi:hypothetical protein